MKPSTFRSLVFSFCLPAALLVAQHSDAPATPASGGEMHQHKPATPSVVLAVTGTDGKTARYSLDELKAMHHLTATVHNMHTQADETYSGVPVSELVKQAEPALATGDKTKFKPLMTVVVFEGTDKYRVVLTECDLEPSCHEGMVLVADTMNGQPLTTDGAFKLISTQDKKPQRWVRNLTSITIQGVE